MARPLRIMFVCTGNICRSPIGEVLLRDLLAAEGLADQVTVTSAGTGDWHVGEPADHRALAVLRSHGHDGEAHRARQFNRDAFTDADLVVALDRSHQRTLWALARTDEDRAKVHLLRSFDADATAAGRHDVVDPYFGTDDDFEQAYLAVAAAGPGLVAHLRSLLAARTEAAR